MNKNTNGVILFHNTMAYDKANTELDILKDYQLIGGILTSPGDRHCEAPSRDKRDGDEAIPVQQSAKPGR